MTEHEKQELARELTQRLVETITQTVGEHVLYQNDAKDVLVLVLGRLLAIARRSDEN